MRKSDEPLSVIVPSERAQLIQMLQGWVSDRTRNLLDLGGLLRMLQRERELDFKFAREWLRQHGVSDIVQTVALRLADGEIKPDALERLSLSVLARIPTADVPAADDTVTIIGDGGCKVSKKFRECSLAERRANWKPNGKVPIENFDAGGPAHRFGANRQKCVSWDIDLERNCLVVQLEPCGLTVDIRITPELRQAVNVLSRRHAVSAA